MLLQLIYNNSFDRLAGALCNTLMHSLWQGILLTAIAGLIIICTRKTSSALRYNLLISALIVFAAGVSVTFLWQYDRSKTLSVIEIPPITKISSNTVQPVLMYVNGQDLSQAHFTVTVNNFLSEHHNSIVLFWFLIICGRTLQLAFGLYGTYLLRRVRVSKVNEHWQQRLRLLADELRLRKAVTLLESGLAKVPMVIGHLKPVILVPVGLLTALPTEEIEAILIHELAHIRRRDWLVNMLQSGMEIIFFFNPAVLWVSKLIRTERENCCDDLAVARNNNKINYIRALVSCEEYQASVPAYAMGFPGDKNTLLNRVKRIVNNRNYSLNFFEKTVLAICLVVFGLGGSAFTEREHIQKALKSVVAVIHHDIKAEKTVKAVNSDTTHKKQTEQVNNFNGSLNRVQQVHRDTIITTGSSALGALVHIVDSVREKGEFITPILPPAKPDSTPLQTVKSMNNGSHDEIHEIGRELYRENLLTDTNHLSISLNESELVVNNIRMSEEVHERIYTQFGIGTNYEGSYNQPYEHRYPDSYETNRRDLSKVIAYELIRDNLVSDKNHFTYKLSKDELLIDGVKQSDELHRRIVDEHFKPDDNFNLNYIFRDPGSNGAQKSYRAEEDSYSSRYLEVHNRQMEAERQRLEAERDKKLVADLLQDGLITDPNNVTFTLTDKEVIINGKKQSDAVQKKYKEKYMSATAGSGWSWTYSHHE
jgi:bla regulator protein BlaR1